MFLCYFQIMSKQAIDNQQIVIEKDNLTRKPVVVGSEKCYSVVKKQILVYLLHTMYDDYISDNIDNNISLSQINNTSQN